MAFPKIDPDVYYESTGDKLRVLAAARRQWRQRGACGQGRPVSSCRAAPAGASSIAAATFSIGPRFVAFHPNAHYLGAQE